MRVVMLLVCALAVAIPGIDAQTRKTTRKPTQRTAKKAPEVPLSRIQADWRCASELGVGVATGRRYCDVLTGNDPKQGVLVTIPPHRGPVTMSFELDRKSTRLNSSHSQISYAVFCLKKKETNKKEIQ